MSRNTYIALFAVVATAQWIVPAGIIWESENALTNGEEFLFQTRPVDPADPFRGKYITLSFEENSIDLPKGLEVTEGDRVYVELGRNAEGYAVLRNIHKERPPDTGGSFMKASVEYVLRTPGEENVILKYSFEKFFLEESKASDAERVYWENSRDNQNKTYAVVMVHDGVPILKDVKINDRSITDIVRELNKSPQ
jgi:uncharacterized membrane-anchored protein